MTVSHSSSRRSLSSLCLTSLNDKFIIRSFLLPIKSIKSIMKHEYCATCKNVRVTKKGCYCATCLHKADPKDPAAKLTWLIKNGLSTGWYEFMVFEWIQGLFDGVDLGKYCNNLLICWLCHLNHGVGERYNRSRLMNAMVRSSVSLRAPPVGPIPHKSL